MMANILSVMNVKAGEKVEKVEKTEKAEKTEKKTVDIKAEVLSVVEKKIEEITKTADLKATLEAVERAEKAIEAVEKAIEELAEVVSQLETATETVDFEAVNALIKLGVNGSVRRLAKVPALIHKAKHLVRKFTEEEEKKTTTTKRASGGRASTKGIGDRKINFKGKVFSIPSYFMRKMGISGGLEGLYEWAESQGYRVTETEDMIIIE